MGFITTTCFSVLRYFLSVQDVKASHMKYHVAFTRFTHFSACFYFNLLTFHEERGFFFPFDQDDVIIHFSEYTQAWLGCH